MGQKVNPIGMRLQVNRTWDSRWYADTKDYGDLLLEDLRMRAFIKKGLRPGWRVQGDHRASSQEVSCDCSHCASGCDYRQKRRRY